MITSHRFRHRPLPVQVCAGGDGFRDFDGSAAYAECRAAAEYRARITVDPAAYGERAPVRRERVLLCRRHAAGWVPADEIEPAFGLLAATPAYRYRTVQA